MGNWSWYSTPWKQHDIFKELFVCKGKNKIQYLIKNKNGIFEKPKEDVFKAKYLGEPWDING